jgi:hypothetical protein
VRDVERARKVTPRAAVDDCELDSLESRDAVDDLVDGPVSADRNEQAGASSGGLPGEIDEVARALG